MVPQRYFESLEESEPYFQKEFPKDGFTHCTDGEFMVSQIAFNLYKKLDDELLILFIDKDKIRSPWRYDDDEQLFPHVYGPLHRDAIMKVTRMLRDRKGDWIFPIQESLK